MRKPYGKVKDKKRASKLRRKLSLRNRISGTSELPRLCVVKSNKHLRALLVNDDNSQILFSMQTYGKGSVAQSGNKEGAAKLGAALANKMKEQKIEKAVFDRSGNKYTGVIATFAEAVRSNGIKF